MIYFLLSLSQSSKNLFFLKVMVFYIFKEILVIYKQLFPSLPNSELNCSSLCDRNFLVVKTFIGKKYFRLYLLQDNLLYVYPSL
jgi:hypothetical protein